MQSTNARISIRGKAQIYVAFDLRAPLWGATRDTSRKLHHLNQSCAPYCASLMCLRKYTMLVSWYTRWRDGERMCSWFALHVYRCVYWRYVSASSWTCSTLAVMLHGCRSLVQEAFLLYAFLCMEHSIVLGTNYTSALCILQVISTMCKLCMSI